MLLGLLVLMACLDPEGHEDSAIILCLLLVAGLAGLCGYSLTALIAGLSFSGPRRKVLVYYGSFGCFFLGSFTVTIAIVRSVMAGFWWTVLVAGLPCCCMSTFMCVFLLCCSSEEMIKAAERSDKEAVADRTIVFHGKVPPASLTCVCSWPGKYESAWDALVTGSRSGNVSAAVVFLPEGSKDFGSHDTIPEEERLQCRCWCVPLYGERKPWGCRWWTKWIANIERAHEEGAEMEVYFFKGMKGRWKVEDFSTAGEEHLRREAIQARNRSSSSRKHFPTHATKGLKAFRKTHVETLPLGTRARCNGSFWRGFQRKNATSWRHLKVLGIHRRPK